MKPGDKIQINDGENIIDAIYLYELDGILHAKVDGMQAEYRTECEQCGKPSILKTCDACFAGDSSFLKYELK